MDASHGFGGRVVDAREGDGALRCWEPSTDEQVARRDGQRLGELRDERRFELRAGVEQHAAVQGQGERRR